MKYLVLLALLAYVYHAWRKQRGPGLGRTDGAQGPASRAAGRAGPGRPAPQEMVACATCGLHLPRDEALADVHGRLYCCARHREQGAA